MLLGFAVILAGIAFDQGSKFLIDTQIENGTIWAVNDYFNLIKVWNTGVSFSMFNNHGMWGVIILSLVSAVVSAVLLYWMIREKNIWKITALALIIGGAVGNLIDRIRFGAVMDFLDFHYKTHHWPAFNVADSLICIGAAFLIIWEILYGNKKGDKLQ